MLNNFIGCYDNVISKDSCQKIIQHFEKVKASELTYTRQNVGNNLRINKDNESYYLSNTSSFVNESVDDIISSTDLWIFDTLKDGINNCYQHYVDEYGILESMSKHSISGCVKIQKTKPSQGYHVWHCEHDGKRNGDRLLLVILYLNCVEDGGETEFLYQRMRIKPIPGRLILCPSGFTHTHRGNPPLTGDKYILSTWIEFV